MFLKKTVNKNGSGFTLIETLVMIFILALIVVAFYGVLAIGTRAVAYSKNRLGAIAVANEKMEIARNLAYNDVGTIHGDCAGTIPQDENVTENGKKYQVHTYATYVDDSFDGTLGGTPNDTAYHDYKKLEITVSWDSGGASSGSVALASSFMSPGLEVATPGDGILSINVFSDQSGGAPVVGASVHVVDSNVGIDEVLQTDSSGNVMLLGAKQDLQAYQITVSKSGYETVATLPPYPTTAYNPINIYASVIGGALNTTNIIENQLANLDISAVDYLGNAVPNVNISLNGGRKMGTAFLTPFTPVYNLAFDGSIGSSGEKDFSSISPGQYTFGLSGSETTYKLIGVDTLSPVSLASGSTMGIKIKVANKNTTGLSIGVIKSTNSSPLVGATVELSNAGFSYDETVTTSSDGMAFFPDSAAIFQPGTYTLTVKADGFADDTTSETINSGSLTTDSISMTAN